jgi:hypothetical protein
MSRKQSDFMQQQKEFTRLDNPAQVQGLADHLSGLNGATILNRSSRQVDLILRKLFPGYANRLRRYWTRGGFATAVSRA